MWDLILLVVLSVGGVALYIIVKRFRDAIDAARIADIVRKQRDGTNDF